MTFGCIHSEIRTKSPPPSGLSFVVVIHNKVSFVGHLTVCI